MISFSFSAVVKQMTFIVLTAVFTQPAVAGDSPLRQVEAGMHDLIYRLSRSVVSIEATRSVSGVLPGFPGQSIQAVASTGLICDSAGHILANAFSVIDYDQIQVSGEDRSLPARVIAVDYQNDVALLSTDMPVGDPVEAYTDPGVCAGQMVLSLCSANGLRAAPSIGFCAGCRANGLLQFSLPVGPGGVGGGVFDLSGRLVGVIIGQSEATGFQTNALPSHRIPEIVKYLLTRGTRWAGFAGIATRLIDINPPLEFSASGMTHLASVERPETLNSGVLVTAVLPGSPASKAGIISGDLVLRIGDQQISTPDDIARIVTALEPGQVIPFTLFRRDRVLNTRVQITARPTGLLSTGNRPTGLVGSQGQSRIADSLFQVLSRLREEVSRVERRLQSLD